MNKYTLLFVFLISITSTFCQSDFSFKIESSRYLKSSFSMYEFNNCNLSVWSNNNLIEQISLSEKQCIAVDSIIYRIGIENLNNFYERKNFTVIIDGMKNNGKIHIDDGGYKDFEFRYGNKSKSIFLNNYYHDKLDILLTYLNSLLKPESQIITFRKTSLNSDTLINYYPDFMFEYIELPDTNYRITDITCFKKGHLVTEILDSISECECCISRKEEFRRRTYWKIYRIDDKNWRKEFYANNTTTSVVEYILEIFPMEITHEVITIHEGIKPSVLISRYYKTELINKKE